MVNLNTEQKAQFSEIFDFIGKSLDITKKQYEKAISSYEFVGRWLSEEDSLVSIYEPEILPQGSFMLGTMIQPIDEDDDLDIDLVCRFTGKNANWTQYDLKKIVGDRLKAHGILKPLIEIPDGRRCWTLNYSKDAKFHMDILPSVVSKGYKIILEKAFKFAELQDADSLAIRITDKKHLQYNTSVNPENWLKSNPFGYGQWFAQRAHIDFQKTALLTDAIQPVPKYERRKLPLQLAVQILKRHRDIMFKGDPDKPVSIIITTLAANAYNKEINVLEALINIVERMPSYIEERETRYGGKTIKWISNPVNPEENFADKWTNEPQREINFFRWLRRVRLDIENAIGQRGLPLIKESLEGPFGKRAILKAFDSYSESLREKRISGSLKMSTGTGILGSLGKTVKDHNFHGEEE